MSKATKDVKKDIFEAAMTLFCGHRYEDVEMRQIAAKCGIAVGTLYNYYPNKRQLYTDIFITSWQETLEEFKKINDLAMSPEQKIRRYITALYGDIEKRRGLRYVLAKSNPCEINQNHEINEFKNTVMTHIKAMVKDVPKTDNFALDSNIDAKIGKIILISAMVLVESHADEREQNIECLCEIARAFIK